MFRTQNVVRHSPFCDRNISKRHHPHRNLVALYARVSSDRQDAALSVAAQFRALRDFAKRNGYVVARECIDEAESGRVADRREFRTDEELDFIVSDDNEYRMALGKS